MNSLYRLFFLFVFVCIPHVGMAADVLVAPPLLDLEVQARDVITKDITIKNQTDHKIYVYATVNEIAVDDSGDIKEFVPPVMDAREKAITSWVEISRARIELDAGQEAVVPLTIRIHPYAEPGEYHAFIGMVSEFNRPLAEAKALRGDADGVILKVSLQDKSSDSLRIVSYLINRFIVNDAGRAMTLTLKNEGTKTSVPAGEIIFYNSRGEEVSSIGFNSNNESIEPGAEKIFSVTVPFEDKLGRFKANATVRYGMDGQSTIFDTVQFYMIPYKLLIIFVLLIVLFSVFVTYLLRRVFYDEVQSAAEPGDLPLYVRESREHTEHEHDIHISKK